MNRNLIVVFILLIVVVFSCKKDDDEKSETPVPPSDMNMIFAKTDVTCHGGNDGSIDISVSGGVAPYSYAWSNGSADEDQTGLTAGNYIVNVLDNNGSVLADTFMITQPEMIQIMTSYLIDTLALTVTGGTPPYSYLWSTGDTTDFLPEYNYSACSVMVTDANDCSAYKEFPEYIILDGIYVFGEATAYNSYNTNARMDVTYNEVTQEERASLFELYIPLKAGADFHISKVEGAVHTTYGPGNGWGVVQNPTADEPKDGIILRGEVAEANGAAFQVSADGMYHVVIDTELMIAVVCQVHWGVIGSATPESWGTSTVLSESPYEPMSMSWEINDLILRAGDFRFRYSNGWKIDLDTIGTPNVRVNTNFGGTIYSLVPGGVNFVNTDAGIYTVLMEYTLGDGYTASLTKTGDLPFTNWSSVVCDAVGNGISWENPAAVPDPSGWGWGNKLIADNSGLPVINGELYTWTWTSVILESNDGFKLRTENGEAPPSGGANFDAGYSNLDVANSSSHVKDTGINGNLEVDLKGPYTITLVIDAADSDAKTIIITEG